MADRRRASATGGILATFRALDLEQRVAAIGALLLIVSTFGPFSFVEAAIVLTAGSVLWLLRLRARGRTFRMPFGDGSVMLLAAVWSALLIAIRVFDRPLGQTALALGCAVVLAAAGLRGRARHDDRSDPLSGPPPAGTDPSPADRPPPSARPRPAPDPETEALDAGLPPPERELAVRVRRAGPDDPTEAIDERAGGDEDTEPLRPEDAPTRAMRPRRRGRDRP